MMYEERTPGVGESPTPALVQAYVTYPRISQIAQIPRRSARRPRDGGSECQLAPLVAPPGFALAGPRTAAGRSRRACSPARRQGGRAPGEDGVQCLNHGLAGLKDDTDERETLGGRLCEIRQSVCIRDSDIPRHASSSGQGVAQEVSPDVAQPAQSSGGRM